MTPVLSLTDVSKHFPVPGRRVLRAVDGVSLSIAPGTTFALVGESGSGKSTLGRLAVRLASPTSGTVTFDGQDVTGLSGRRLRRLRPRMQVIFQDPLGALNPRMTAGQIVAEPLSAIGGLRGSTLDDRVDELFRSVGLDPGRRTARPRALSGGQRQRVGIARAIALKPDLILADEAVSALDVSVQAQIANLLDELRERLGVAYLFIGHGLPIVRQLAQRVGVLYLGRLVESGPVDEVFGNPRHPYTQALIASSPAANPGARRERTVFPGASTVLPDGSTVLPGGSSVLPGESTVFPDERVVFPSERTVLPGEPPNPLALPTGCRFRTRCPLAIDVCAHEAPPTVHAGPDHTVECHLIS